MLWLQEKKKACGIDQNRYLKAAVGYGLTRFLLPVIAQQSMKESVTVLAHGSCDMRAGVLSVKTGL